MLMKLKQSPPLPDTKKKSNMVVYYKVIKSNLSIPKNYNIFEGVELKDYFAGVKSDIKLDEVF